MDLLIQIAVALLLPLASIWHPTVGAHPAGPAVAAWSADSARVGPLYSQRVYYATLPDSYWDDDLCSGLPDGVVCVVSFRDTSSPVADYVRSIPASRQVILSFWHEPELNGAFASGADFVAAFDAMATTVHAQGESWVKTATISAVSQYYNSGQTGYDCSYLPGPGYSDYYLADAYDRNRVGLWNHGGFNRWMTCTNGFHHGRGLAEWGIVPDACGTGSMTRAEDLATTVLWLRSVMPHMVLIEYYDANVANGQPTDDPCSSWSLVTDQEISEYQQLAAQY